MKRLNVLSISMLMLCACHVMNAANTLFDLYLKAFITPGDYVVPEALSRMFKERREEFLCKLSDYLLPHASKFVIESPTNHADLVGPISWNTDGTCLASGTKYGVNIWRWTQGYLKLIAYTNIGPVYSLEWGPHGNYVALGSANNTITIWHRDQGYLEKRQAMHGPKAEVTRVALSPDGTYLASGSCRSNKIEIWQWGHGKFEKLQTLQGHKQSVGSLAWSHDSNYLASSSMDNTVEIWQLKHEYFEKLQTLRGHRDYVSSVAWSFNGKYLASGSNDETIKIWQWEYGYLEELQTLSGHKDVVGSVAWSHAGNYLVSGSTDETIKIWKMFKENNQGAIKKQFKNVDTIPTRNAVSSIAPTRCGTIAYVADGDIGIISPMPFLNQHSATLEGLREALIKKLFPL